MLVLATKRELYTNIDSNFLLRKDKRSIIGTVDRETSTVGKDFTDLVMCIQVTKGLFLTNAGVGISDFTPEEIAAIILHEVGHIFTYFEYMGEVVTTNYVLQHVSKSIMETRDIEQKYKNT